MSGVTTAQVDARAKSAGLPGNWRSMPTTSAAESVTVWAIGQEYGAKKGQDFKSWYDNALQADPTITPDQAVGAWLTGAAVSGGTAKAGQFVGQQLPQAVVDAASNVKIPGLDFFGHLLSSATLIRVVKVIVGGAMLIIGLAHISGASNQLMDVARKVPLPI